MELKKINNIVTHIRHNIAGMYISGSVKRKEPIINDIDIITKRELSRVLDDFKYFYNAKVNKEGDSYMQIKLDDITYGPIIIDIWKANSDSEYKFLKWMRNLDKGHNIFLKKKAKERGYSLSDRGLRNLETGAYREFDTKKDLIDFLLK